jgi:redox-sensitive bicupin YhaK (pirin superfamily)
MITVRKSNERGHADHGWLKTFHTFSFADYFDRKNMHFRTLRVINEDFVDGGQGFGTHPHNDMEIITIVLSGALEHRDSMGNHGLIKPGEIQYMSAGTGVRHSEYNASKTEPVHLFQVWIMPEGKGLPPTYDQKTIPTEAIKNQLHEIAARQPQNGAVKVRQDVTVFRSQLENGKEVTHELKPGRGAWLQVAAGSVNVNGTELKQGDGAAIEGEAKLAIRGTEAENDFILFDLA